MKKALKAWTARVARSRPVRSFVANLVYPTIVRCLNAEIQTDVVSPSGLAEAFAWKSHAYLVLNEELRLTGRDCSSGNMRCDRETRAAMIDVVVEHIKTVEGEILEFGVYQGESVRAFASRCPERRVFGFDSFEGLPESWWTRPKGTFKTDVPTFEQVNVTLVKGFFDASVPRFLEEWTGSVALLHIDCDLYESTRLCLLPLLQRCRVGTVVLFDEYYNYSDFAAHEWLAWHEAKDLYRIVAPCIAYDGRRAAFRISQLDTVPGRSAHPPS
jgi:hypothetical protein